MHIMNRFWAGKRPAEEESGETEAILQGWRQRALHFSLLVIIIMGFPAYISPILNGVKNRALTPLLWGYLVIYLGFIGLAVLPRLDLRYKGWGLLLLAYTSAIASFARLGLAGSGRLYLVSIPVIAILLVGSQAGYITAVISLGIYIAFAALAQSGRLDAWLAVQNNPTDLAFLIEAGAALVVFLALLIVLLERYYALQMSVLADRRQAMAALEGTARTLQEREERLELVVQASNDGIWDWDLRTGQVYFSPRWMSMLGYADHEVGNSFESWKALLHPDDKGRAMSTLQDHLEGRTPYYELEHRLRHKDGEYRWILARGLALREPSGKAYRLVGSHTDITGRRQAEEEIWRQNEFLEALHQTALGVVSRLDLRELLEAIVERAVNLVGADSGFIFLETADKEAIETKVGLGVDRKHIGARLKPWEGLAGTIWQTGQPLVVADYQLWPHRSALYAEDAIGPAMGAPLKSGAEVIGVLGVTRPPESAPFRRDEMESLNRLAQLASIALDNARLHTSLQKHLAFERLITNISTEFINLGPQEVDAGIQHALQATGQFAWVDRSFVFIFSEDWTRMENTHEWCAPGIVSQRERFQNPPVEVTPWTIAKIKRLEVVIIPRVVDLPEEASLDRQEFQAQGIQATIALPMVYQGEAIGSIGYEMVGMERDWSGEDITLLRVVGEIIVNALEHKRAQAIQAGQRRFLELLATGGEFSATLHALVGLIEEQWPGMLGLVLLLDEDGKHLHVGAFDNLPEEYARSIEGLEIGPRVGSCGTACYTRQRVIVEDIATDPRWEGLRNLGLRYGLRACWSEPVFSADGQVAGTFAMYYRQPRAPTKAELHTIETAAHLVGVAIEHKRVEKALHESELRFRAVFEGAPIGISVTSLEARLVETNRALQAMFGYTGDEFYNLSVPEFTYPEDVETDQNLFFNELVPGKRDHYQLEKRFIRKSGETFWGRLSLSLARGLQGEPLFAIATTEDITEQKQAAEQLAQAYQTLEQRVRERTRELAAVNAIAAVVSRSLDLDRIMSDALDMTLEVIGTEAGAAYRLDEDSHSLVLMAQRGLSAGFVQRTARLPLEIALAGKSIREDGPVVWQVLAEYPQGELKKSILEEGLQVMIGVPLLVKGRLVGALVLSTRILCYPTPEELSLLTAVGQQIAVAVENARLYEQVQQTALLEERNRLSRELHDSVTQSLYSVTLYAEAAARLFQAGDSRAAADHLRELRDTAQEALREMRLLIYELRPPILGKSGLSAALQARLEAVEARAGLHTELQVEGEEGLPPAIREELYHIAREAFNNLLKHARARNVRVRLLFQDGSTLLEICDDGVGFDLAAAQAAGGLAGGFGLAGMQERAQRIGAQLQIQSAPGKGTTVRVRVSH